MELTMRIAISVLVGVALAGLVWFGSGLWASLRASAESSDDDGAEEED